MIARTLPEYDRPPVIEVVCGVRFQPLRLLRVGHIGIYWARIREEFTKCEHAAPLGPGQEAIDPSIGTLMPRVWFVNAAGDRLIQIQNNRFLYNWRQLAIDQPYPRYHSIQPSFFKHFAQYEEFCRNENLDEMVIVEFELSYVNHIPWTDSGISAGKMAGIIPDAAWNSATHKFLPLPSSISWQAEFEMEPRWGRMIAKMNPAKRLSDNTNILVLEISVRGIPTETPKENLTQWFSHAHDWIVRGFEDLTAAEAQASLWGKHV